MNEEQYKFLKLLTFGTCNELFEVIDADGIRKPAIRTKIRDVEPSPNGEKNFNKEFWTLEIDWRLINRWKTVKENKWWSVIDMLCGVRTARRFTQMNIIKPFIACLGVPLRSALNVERRAAHSSV